MKWISIAPKTKMVTDFPSAMAELLKRSRGTGDWEDGIVQFPSRTMKPSHGLRSRELT